jgi:lipopolysaccharide heptosyltransferase II
MSAGEWRDARNVLCVRLDNLGDVIMTAPAIRALRFGRSDRRITLLASSGGVEAAALIPGIDAAISYDAPWMKASAPGACAHDAEMIRTLSEGRFDAAVIFTVYSQSPLPAALMTYLAGIPLRAAHCRENPYGLLTHWVRETEPHRRVRHEVERQLDLAMAVGAAKLPLPPRLHVPLAARASLAKRLVEQGVRPGEQIVVVHPGASAASRRYPAERFGAAVCELVGRRRCRVIVTGSAGERDVVEAVCAAAAQPAHVIGWAGALSLAELAALLARARLLISNNTGPVHIASSLGTPVVDLYALTNPQHGPWNVPHRVLFHDVPCRFCYRSVCPQGHHRCLLGVPAQDVAEAACAMLDGRHAAASSPAGQDAVASPVVGWFPMRRQAA